MSVVYLAEHVGLRRKVALSDLASPGAIAWRSRTAATTTSRRSPAIPKGNRLVAGWFTNQFDGDFHNRSDVELVRLNDHLQN
jgi:hypothetical protein